MSLFDESQRKIERAEKHISELDSIIKRVCRSDYYSLVLNQDIDGSNWILLDFNPKALPSDEAALVIGDILHNLRSSLDILWHTVIRLCDGIPSKWSRFLIRDTQDELVAALNGALKESRITPEVQDFVLNTIKPHKTGNYSLWALEELNLRDKHQLIIPVIKFLWILGACLEDENGNTLELPILIGEICKKTRIDPRWDGRKLKIKNNGHSAPNIFFSEGYPFENYAVMTPLCGIAEEVTGTVLAFDVFFRGIGE